MIVLIIPYPTSAFSRVFQTSILFNLSPKTLLKAPVVLNRPLRRAPQVVFRTPPSHLRHMALHQQAIDILIRVPSSALMDSLRVFSKGKGGHTVILCDYDIAPLAEVDQRDIHRVCPGADHLDRAVIRGPKPELKPAPVGGSCRCMAKTTTIL